jgi:microtubule-associated protein, RP/EB family
LQWIKRFWDSNYGGQGYDAVGRRRGAPTDTPATIAPLAPSSTRTSGLGAGAGARAGGRTPIGGRAGSAQPNEALQALHAQLREMTMNLEGLEKERDFYFAKVSRNAMALQEAYHYSTIAQSLTCST